MEFDPKLKKILDSLHLGGDAGNAYAKRLAEAGVWVQHKCYESMIRGIASITGSTESAEAGLYDSAAALREAFNA